MSFVARNHPQQKTRTEVDDRQTDPEVFAGFREEFDFTIDVAALPHNTKMPRYYTPGDDGLARSWSGERVWCNPPYSDIRPWVEKAHREIFAGKADRVVMLVPANRTEQAWWQDLVEGQRSKGGLFSVQFLRGRMRFIAANDTEIRPNARPPFGVCLLKWTNPVQLPEQNLRDLRAMNTEADK